MMQQILNSLPAWGHTVAVDRKIQPCQAPAKPGFNAAQNVGADPLSYQQFQHPTL
jgi:hypothetical protein